MSTVIALHALSMSDRLLLGLPTHSRRIVVSGLRESPFAHLDADGYHEKARFDPSYDDDDAFQDLALDQHMVSTFLDDANSPPCHCGVCAVCLVEEAQDSYHRPAVC